jgi:hypothetical protein
MLLSDPARYARQFRDMFPGTAVVELVSLLVRNAQATATQGPTVPASWYALVISALYTLEA